jgi:maltose O-acetyltransferase
MAKILKVIQFDKNSKFESGIYISDARNLEIGKHVRINENVFLQGSITIGDFVMIAPNVSIYTKTHRYGDINTPMVLSGESETKTVTIENDVWLGLNAVVLPGITVGKGSIIGANSVVTKNVEPYSIIGGVPAHLIRKRV